MCRICHSCGEGPGTASIIILVVILQNCKPIWFTLCYNVNHKMKGRKMAKYEITHSCGCTETVNVCGTNAHGERDRKIAWLESVPCRKCEAAAKADAASASGLPELEGSEKQVAWAIDIRDEMLGRIDDFAKLRVKSPVPDVFDAILGEIRAEVAGHTAAGWFIDNRNSLDVRRAFAEKAKRHLEEREAM